jgi:hypothetical protein
MVIFFFRFCLGRRMQRWFVSLSPTDCLISVQFPLTRNRSPDSGANVKKSCSATVPRTRRLSVHSVRKRHMERTTFRLLLVTWGEQTAITVRCLFCLISFNKDMHALWETEVENRRQIQARGLVGPLTKFEFSWLSCSKDILCDLLVIST